jgi:hypothetical protein
MRLDSRKFLVVLWEAFWNILRFKGKNISSNFLKWNEDQLRLIEFTYKHIISIL